MKEYNELHFHLVKITFKTYRTRVRHTDAASKLTIQQGHTNTLEVAYGFLVFKYVIRDAL